MVFSLNLPKGVYTPATSTREVYIADTENNLVRKLNSNDVVSIVAGSGTRGYTGDNGPAKDAPLNSPFAVAVSENGGIYIADKENSCIRKVNTIGIIHTYAGTRISGD